MTGKRPTEADIIIVGAGPTGLLLANLLGTMKVDCLMLERNSSTVDEPRAVSLDDESMRALQAAGLDKKVSRLTARGYGSLYRAPSGRVFVSVKPSARDYGFEKRNAFQQPELEALLRDALKRHPSVTVRFDTEVVGLEQGTDKVTVHAHNDGNDASFFGQYVVACDGGRSTIRRLLDVPMVGATFEEPWLIVDLAETQNRCFHTEVFCDPKRSGITLPGPGGIRRYEFKLNAGETVEQAETESFARALLRSVGLDGDAPIRRLKVYTFHARTAERWRDGRVLLAGDAAHLTPPFAGQGMNSGLRDAHNLAWKLHEALSTSDAEELLASYQVERKPHAWAMIELAMRMGQVMMPSSRFKGWATRTGFRALRFFGPASDYVTQMRYKPKPRFAGGLVEPDRRPPKRSAVGRMLPQPLVDTASRDRVLLDAVLPDKPTVLIFDQRPDECISSDSLEAIRSAGGEVIGLTPESVNPVDAAFPIVRDHSRLFASKPFCDYLGYALLVRRDRYVMAAKPAAQAEELVALIARLSPGGLLAAAKGQENHHKPQKPTAEKLREEQQCA